MGFGDPNSYSSVAAGAGAAATTAAAASATAGTTAATQPISTHQIPAMQAQFIAPQQPQQQQQQQQGQAQTQNPMSLSTQAAAKLKDASGINAGGSVPHALSQEVVNMVGPIRTTEELTAAVSFTSSLNRPEFLGDGSIKFSPELCTAVAELLVIEKRDAALTKLVHLRDDPALPLLIWYSFGALSVLIQELIATFALLSPPRLSREASNRCSQVLGVLQAVVQNEHTRSLFFNGRLMTFVSPFLRVRTPHDRVCVTALGVFVVLLRSNDPRVYHYCLNSEFLRDCLEILHKPTELTRPIAAVAIDLILNSQEGYEFAHSDLSIAQNLCQALASSLTSVPNSRPTSLYAKTLVQAFFRLRESANQNLAQLVVSLVPVQAMSDPTFIEALEGDHSIRRRLDTLLQAAAHAQGIPLPPHIIEGIQASQNQPQSVQNLPTMQTMPSMPNMPNLPNLPNMSNMPNMPAMPNMMQNMQGVQGIQNVQSMQGIQPMQGVPSGAMQGIQNMPNPQTMHGMPAMQGMTNVQAGHGMHAMHTMQAMQGMHNLQGMHGVPGMHSVQGIHSMPNMHNLQGMQGMQGMQNMQGLQGVQGMQGMQGMQTMPSMQGMPGMHGMPGMMHGMQGHVGGVASGTGGSGLQ